MSAAFSHLFNNEVEKWAKSKVGSTEYQRWDAHPETNGRFEEFLRNFGFGNSNKCNVFVYDALTAGGQPPGRMLEGRVPIALEWADPVFVIGGYEIVQNPSVFSLKPGDVVSDGNHVGIFSPLSNGTPGTISASAITQEVIHNDWGFRPGSVITVRRWIDR